MKRFLFAAVLAVLFHAGVFGLDFDWVINKTARQQPRSTAVTISMSYRHPEPVIETRAEPVRQVEQRPREEKPKKIKKVSPRPKPADHKEAEAPPERPEQSSAEEKQDKAVAEENAAASSIKGPVLEDNHQVAIPSDGLIVQVTKEAVPSYRINPAPRYPRAARRRGYQGTVVLSVFVDENGRVANLWVFTSSGYRLLDNAAVKDVRKWTFEPGMKGDKKVAMWVKVPIRFELK